GQGVKDRLPALLVLFRGHEAQRLVVEPDAGRLAGAQRLAVHGDAVARGDVEGGRVDDLAVHRDAALGDQRLGGAARGDAGAGQHLGDPVTGPLVAGGGDGGGGRAAR